MPFAHLKRILGLSKLRLRGPSGAKNEFLLAATAQNLRNSPSSSPFRRKSSPHKARRPVLASLTTVADRRRRDQQTGFVNGIRAKSAIRWESEITFTTRNGSSCPSTDISR
jgi:hypothetical protein